MIPLAGRDVQCSNCGHVWFQTHPDSSDDQAHGITPLPKEKAPLAPPRREPDPAALSVLREEAARERAAREAERAALEVQADLDLPAPPSNTMADPEDTARAMRPAPRRNLLPDIEEINSTLEPAEHMALAPPPPPRPPESLAVRRHVAGRRLGFTLAIAVFAAAALMYLQGPRIGDAVPAFKPPIDAYVARIDQGRRWLDGALRRAAGAEASDGEG